MAEKIVKSFFIIIVIFGLTIFSMSLTDNFEIKINEEFPPERKIVKNYFTFLVKEQIESDSLIFKFKIDSIIQNGIIENFYVETDKPINDYYIQINNTNKRRFTEFESSLRKFEIGKNLLNSYDLIIKEESIVSKYVLNLNFCFKINGEIKKVAYSKFRIGL